MASITVRVNRDVIADVFKDGEQLHTNVRTMRSIDGRVAVFLDKTGPPIVYPPDTVEFTPKRTPCSCKGDVPKARLLMNWSAADKATVP